MQEATHDFAAGMDGELMRFSGSIRRSTLKLAFVSLQIL